MALIGALFTRRLRQPSSVPIGARIPRARGASPSAPSCCRRSMSRPSLIVLLTAPIAVSAFSAAKQAIPMLHGFTWDTYLSVWGSRLDGGRPLWQRLQPVLGTPEITTALDWFYHRAWPVLLLAAFVWTALLRPSALRRRFLFSFALLFLVVGTLIALALASAGPPYYAFVSPGHGPVRRPVRVSAFRRRAFAAALAPRRRRPLVRIPSSRRSIRLRRVGDA